MYAGTMLGDIDRVIDVIKEHDIETFADLVDYVHFVREERSSDLRYPVYNNYDFWIAYLSAGQAPPVVNVHIGSDVVTDEPVGPGAQDVTPDADSPATPDWDDDFGDDYDYEPPKEELTPDFGDVPDNVPDDFGEPI